MIVTVWVNKMIRHNTQWVNKLTITAVIYRGESNTSHILEYMVQCKRIKYDTLQPPPKTKQKNTITEYKLHKDIMYLTLE